MYSIEEYPPPPRRKPQQPEPAKAGPRIARAALTLLAAALVVAGYTRLALRLSAVTSELEDARASLNDVRGSLGMLWTTTTKLDENRVAQQDVLRDSIGLVRNYAEGGMRLWETAFEDHERRVSGNAARLRAEQLRIDRLSDVTTGLGARLDEVAADARALDVAIGAARGELASLGDSLAALSSQLGAAETRLTARLGTVETGLTSAGADQSRTAGRVDDIERWVDSFRNQDLDAVAVRERLAALAADLRLVALRVDSLGTRIDSTRTVIDRTDPG